MRRVELASWIAVAVVLCALAIPWFLWGDGTIVAGLPLWLWWHVGWLLLASVVFQVFANRAWGIGIEPDSTGGADAAGGSDAAGGVEAGSGGEPR
ncbi:DUF3311 domain-containing protein [Natrialbaceae archaeon GCM10025810]|uniref:DUF3311 domain-containing protein n=1 Tax=Halovalidus salilacus TaxID=3075124 RepID=UPI00360FF587